MKGMIYKTAKGYKSYEIFEVDESFIFKMTDILIDKLGFNGKLFPVIGVNGCYLDLKKNQIKITVGWDNWSGCFAMAHCDEGEDYIIRLSGYMDEVIKEI